MSNPGPPPYEATTQMPATVLAAGGGFPPGTPPPTSSEQPGWDTPWYKPGPLLIVLLVLLLLGGVIAWLFLRGGDDKKASPGSARLTLVVSDETGAPVDTGFIVSVTGPADSSTAYTWLQPTGIAAGQPAGDSTGSDGSVAFEWQPDEATVDAATWAATVSIPAAGAGRLDRARSTDRLHTEPLGQGESVVSMSATVQSPDSAGTRSPPTRSRTNSSWPVTTSPAY